MSNLLTYTITDGDDGGRVALVFADGVRNITETHANYAAIVKLLIEKPEGYAETAYDLVNIAKTVQRKFRNLSDRVSTDGSNLFFDGDPIDSSLGRYIMKKLHEDSVNFGESLSSDDYIDEFGAPDASWEALVKFLELLYANPNPGSRESLYNFIARYGLTIRHDGHFIAYKGLNEDFSSIHSGGGIVDGVEVSGSLMNKPGSILRIPRSQVDANTKNGCAYGLHAGTHAYASEWARGKLVLVAINPMHVVSVPDDCTFQKIRTCEYEVIAEANPLEVVATDGWAAGSSNSFFGDRRTNFSSVASDEYSEGDNVSFEYTALNGNRSTVNGTVDSVGDDYIVVHREDGAYRSYSLSGIVKIAEEKVASNASSDEDYPVGALVNFFYNGKEVLGTVESSDHGTITVKREDGSYRSYITANIEERNELIVLVETSVVSEEDDEPVDFELEVGDVIDIIYNENAITDLEVVEIQENYIRVKNAAGQYRTYSGDKITDIDVTRQVNKPSETLLWDRISGEVSGNNS